jgi:hypothetical protein
MREPSTQDIRSLCQILLRLSAKNACAKTIGALAHESASPRRAMPLVDAKNQGMTTVVLNRKIKN